MRDISSPLSSVRFSGGTVLSILLLLFALLSLVVFIAEGRLSNVDADAGVLATFALMGCLGVFALVREISAVPFSLPMMHWFFYLVFFVIAPLNQYLCGEVPWGYGLDDAAYLSTNALLLGWGVLFLFGTCLRFAKGGGEHRTALDPVERLPVVTRSAAAICAFASLACCVAFMTLVGIDGVFSRATAVWESSAGSAAYLVQDKILRSVPVVALVIVGSRWRVRGDSVVPLLLCAVSLLLTDFPTALPRYGAAVVYGGLALLFVPALTKRKGLFALLFLVAFVFVFPSINVFRSDGFSFALFAEALVRSIANLPQGFLGGDYDAYSMLARSIDYLGAVGCSWGFQFVGVLLFFIPRAIWPSKPVGTGYMISQAQGQAFNNVSCPLPAEMLVNFGFVGMLAAAFLFGVLVRRIHVMANKQGGGYGLRSTPSPASIFSSLCEATCFRAGLTLSDSPSSTALFCRSQEGRDCMTTRPILAGGLLGNEPLGGRSTCRCAGLCVPRWGISRLGYSFDCHAWSMPC